MKRSFIVALALVIILCYPPAAHAAGENDSSGENDIVMQSDTIGDENLAADDESSPDGAAENTSRNFLFFLFLLIALGMLTNRKNGRFRK